MFSIFKDSKNKYIASHLWAQSWPAMLSGLSVPLLGFIDTAIVGHLPTPEALGAVAIGAWLVDLLFWSCGFLRMSTTALSARGLGEGKSEIISTLFYQSTLLGFGLGSIILFIGLMSGSFISALMTSDILTESLATEYINGRIFGAPATLANYALFGWLLGQQFPRVVLLAQLAVQSLNIILSLWLSVTLNVFGVAVASALSQWVLLIVLMSLALYSTYQKNDHRDHNIEILFSVLHKPTLEHLRQHNWTELIHLSTDIFIRTLALLSVFGMFTLMGGQLGSLILAANAVLLQLQSLLAFALDGFAHGAEVLVGAAVGKSKSKATTSSTVLSTSLSEIDRIINVGFYLSGITAVLLSMCYFLTGSTLISLLTDHETVLEQARILLIWIIISPLISFPCFFYDGVLIGAGRGADLKRGMIISALIFVSSAYVLVINFESHGLWASLMVFMATRALTLKTSVYSLSKRTSVDF